MIYIQEAFRTAIASHLAGNLLVRKTESPLILGIFGPPGEGKTFQVDHVLAEMNVEPLLVSPGELENENAGHPAQMLRTLYMTASAKRAEGQVSALVMNDIDTVLGDWGQLVQYTVNRQVVLGQLMAFCDFPTQVAGKPVSRVPIIVTGNNPTILYGPLMRPGRMRAFQWKPDAETKQFIVSGIFPQFSASEVQRLVSVRQEQPVAFWSDVKAALWEASVVEWLNRQEERHVLSMLRAGEQVDVSNSDGLAAVEAMADRLAGSDARERNYLT